MSKIDLFNNNKKSLLETLRASITEEDIQKYREAKAKKQQEVEVLEESVEVEQSKESKWQEALEEAREHESKLSTFALGVLNEIKSNTLQSIEDKKLEPIHKLDWEVEQDLWEEQVHNGRMEMKGLMLVVIEMLQQDCIQDAIKVVEQQLKEKEQDALKAAHDAQRMLKAIDNLGAKELERESKKMFEEWSKEQVQSYVPKPFPY